MKILLLRPFIDTQYDAYPPLSLMYLSSYLKSKQIEVALMDMVVDIKSFRNFSPPYNRHIQKMISDIKNINPAIIGMTLFSRELKQISQVSKLLKTEFPSTFIVLGGAHPTVMPKETLEQIQDCDFVVRGESELILSDLIESLANNKDLNNVKGIAFRLKDNNEICLTPDSDIIEDLDALPFPDRECLINNYHKKIYRSVLFGSPIDNIMSSRGCVYNCHFCAKVCIKYRSRTPENVIKEIDWVINNVHPQTIQIMDDSFTLQRDRCQKILEIMIEKKYKCKFRVRSRVDAIDDGLLKKMKKAGVDTVVYGFESGSQKMLDSFNKRTYIKQNFLACELTRKNRLNCFGDMLLFYPGETKETLKETENFIKLAKPTLTLLNLLTPLPKTKVFEDAKRNGTLVGSWDINSSQPWVKIHGFDSVEIMEDYVKKMRTRILLNPRRLLWIIKSYGISIMKNPIISIRMMFAILFGKARY